MTEKTTVAAETAEQRIEQRIEGLVCKIEAHQEALGLPDTKFVARYQKHLGSARTWRQRFCARAFDGLRLDQWERRLARFVAEIYQADELSGFIGTLPMVRYGEHAYEALQGQTSDRRVAWLIAPTGCGKSWTMRHIAAEHPLQAVFLHVNRASKDNMGTLTRMLARAVGAGEQASAAATFEGVVAALRESPMTMMIDDVHEGGVLLLKLIKHLVDEAPRSRFILALYPTAYASLAGGSSAAQVECQQLLGRSIKPLELRWIGGLTDADVAAALSAAVPGVDTAAARVAADAIAGRVRRHGNLRVLFDAIETAQINADAQDEELTMALVESAVRLLCPAA
jgi:hypothetical protein